MLGLFSKAARCRNAAGSFEVVRRSIATTSLRQVKKMPDRPGPIAEEEFTESFLKGSGPGGQKINKTSSAVQLKHIPTGIVLKVQATRSRIQNRKIARQMLADRVEELEKGKESRVAVVGETKKKRKSSAVKKSKRKYKLLDAAKNQISNENAAEMSEQINDPPVAMEPNKSESSFHQPPSSKTP